MKTTYLIPALALAALVLSACKYTGGGHMDSAVIDAGKKANYNFNVQACNGEEAQGHFTYHDKGYPDLKIKGEVTNAVVCDSPAPAAPPPPAECPPNDFECMIQASALNGNVTNSATCTSFCKLGELKVDFDYQSINPKNPGEGVGYACVNSDTGFDLESAVIVNGVYISLIGGSEDGPYHGYKSNKASVASNVQRHECPKPAKANSAANR